MRIRDKDEDKDKDKDKDKDIVNLHEALFAMCFECRHVQF